MRDALPDAEAVYAFPVEEVAWVLLRQTISEQRSGLVSLEQFTQEVDRWQDLPRQKKGLAIQAITEAWAWLLNNGLLVQAPGQSAMYKVTTRLADGMVDRQEFDDFKSASLLKRDLLHPSIAEKAWPTFIRGDFETAVFQSFKEVEIRVRTAGNFTDKDVGVSLMRKAFDKDTGPLTDNSLPEAEREALAHLFAGAIGSYKNPSSHRTVTISDPLEAGEMLMLAGHLLRIVEARSSG